MDSIYRKLILVEADTSGLQRLDADTKKAQAVLNQMGFATEKVSKVTQDSTQVMSKYGQITTKSMYTIQTESDKTFKVMVQGGQKATAQMGDFERAMRRVLIVVPVWYLFRTAFMFAIRGFWEGVKQLEEFDRAMLKAKAVVHDAKMDMSEAFRVLEERIRTLSLTTGESVEKLASSFYRFGTVGTEFEKAMRGMEASIKLAMATQGDADETAKNFALAFKLLGDTIDEAIPPQLREISVASKMYKLWQINAFEQNEFNEALRQFIPVANTANITLDQTIALLSALHSAGLQGSRAGTLIRTSFAKLIEALPEVGEKLGIKVVPEKIGVFGALMEVLRKLKEVKDAGRLEELEGYFEDLFGGVRGAQPAKALVAVFDLLNKNLEITTGDLQTVQNQMGDFNKRIEEVTDSTSKQMEIFRNLRTHIWEAFVTGIVGGKDFNEAMKQINKTMESMVGGAKMAGEILRKFVIHAVTMGAISPLGTDVRDILEKRGQYSSRQTTVLMNKLQKAYKGEMNLEELRSLEEELSGWNERTLINKQKNLEALQKIISNKEKEINLEIKHQEEQKKVIEQTKEQAISYDGIVKSLDKELIKHQDKIKYLQMELAGATALEISQQKIKDRVGELVEEYNKLTEQGAPVSPLNTEQILSFVQSKQYSEILKLTNNRIINEEKIKELIKLQAQAEEENIKVIAEINVKEKERISISQAVNKVRAEGVLNSEELLQYEIKLVENATYFATAKERELELLKLRNQLEIEHINRTKDLTSKEKEGIDIQSQINVAKKLGIMNSIQLIDYERQLVDNAKYAYTEYEKKLKLYQLEKQYLEELIELTSKYAEEFKGTFRDSLKDLFLGEANISDFFGNLQQKLIDMWATSMSTGLTNVLGQTGIFADIGSIFGGIESGLGGKIAQAHLEGIRQGAEIIKRAHIDGMNVGVSGVGGGVAGGAGGGVGFSGLPSGGGLPGWFPFNQKLNNPMGSFWGNMSWMKGLTGFGMGAMGGYQTGGIGGAVTGGLSSLFTMAGHPILGALFALPSMFGLFEKKKSWTRTEVQESLNQIPSKIDISNKQLAMVNRNLVALKEELTYIMQRSYYFSERDRFSIDGGRGEQ